jgi:hypothetical protein
VLLGRLAFDVTDEDTRGVAAASLIGMNSVIRSANTEAWAGVTYILLFCYIMNEVYATAYLVGLHRKGSLIFVPEPAHRVRTVMPCHSYHKFL